MLCLIMHSYKHVNRNIHPPTHICLYIFFVGMWAPVKKNIDMFKITFTVAIYFI